MNAFVVTIVFLVSANPWGPWQESDFTAAREQTAAAFAFWNQSAEVTLGGSVEMPTLHEADREETLRLVNALPRSGQTIFVTNRRPHDLRDYRGFATAEYIYTTYIPGMPLYFRKFLVHEIGHFRGLADGAGAPCQIMEIIPRFFIPGCEPLFR